MCVVSLFVSVACRIAVCCCIFRVVASCCCCRVLAFMLFVSLPFTCLRSLSVFVRVLFNLCSVISCVLDVLDVLVVVQFYAFGVSVCFHGSRCPYECF